LTSLYFTLGLIAGQNCFCSFLWENESKTMDL